VSSAAGGIAIEEARSLDGLINGLAELLVDAVASGASVGFVAPFGARDAAEWWRSLGADIESGRVILLVARERDRVVGHRVIVDGHGFEPRDDLAGRTDAGDRHVHRTERRRSTQRDRGARGAGVGPAVSGKHRRMVRRSRIARDSAPCESAC